MELGDKIRKMLDQHKPWERVPTNVEGLFLLKAPSRNDKEQLMIEINPLNEAGNPMKRRGLFLTNTMQVEGFKKLLNRKEVIEVVEAIQSDVPEGEKIQI